MGLTHHDDLLPHEAEPEDLAELLPPGRQVLLWVIHVELEGVPDQGPTWGARWKSATQVRTPLQWLQETQILKKRVCSDSFGLCVTLDGSFPASSWVRWRTAWFPSAAGLRLQGSGPVLSGQGSCSQQGFALEKVYCTRMKDKRTFHNALFALQSAAFR